MKIMKKYLLFAYDKYYPAGGFNDLHSAYDNEDKANEVAKQLIENQSYDYVCVHSIDDIDDIIKSHSWIKDTK